ncbi:MAG TPA: lysoplasmalogenase [Chitinophagaceae bacterium]|nr:lysoplasmalogenase [Chitinophagaceae bacterium]
MKKTYWIIFFAIILAVELTGIQLKNETIQFIFKPLLMIVVGGYFLSQVNRINNSLKGWIIAALLFSWIGDILLMFQAKNDTFFLPGLSAFLLAHVSYIIFFHGVRVRENIRSNILLLLIVVIYYAILITILSPHLGDMKLPVRIYGIVISFMFMLAMHMLFMKNKIAGRWMMTGALLFVISDSVLAINKFYQPFETAGIIIMLTYALAQLFIIEGAKQYIHSSNSN